MTPEQEKLLDKITLAFAGLKSLHLSEREVSALVIMLQDCEDLLHEKDTMEGKIEDLEEQVSGLEKEKEELEANYDFVTGEGKNIQLDEGVSCLNYIDSEGSQKEVKKPEAIFIEFEKNIVIKNAKE